MPLTGDIVEFSGQSAESGGFIEKILERKNVLVRPMVANIDRLIIVLSVSKPHPDLLLVDKLLLQAEKEKVSSAICLNKTDSADGADAENLRAQYSYYPFAMVSALTGAGLGELKDLLRNRVSAVAGQSAVGKSSLLNVLNEELSLKTGDLSKKVNRGRHTTRRTELIAFPDLNAYVIDTPGFSIFETPLIDEQSLSALYPEFTPHLNRCRFSGCLHRNEPDCAVKQAVGNGIHPQRYERYRMVLQIIKDKRSKQYD